MTRWLSFAIAVSALAQPLPPLSELVRDALRNQRLAVRELTEYTYDYRSVMRQHNQKGKLTKESITTGESYQSANRNVNVEFTQNGKRHSERGIRQRSKEAAEKMQADYEARRKRPPANEEGPEHGVQLDNLRMETFVALRDCPLSNLRHETANGRPAYAIDFGPAPPETKFKAESLRHMTRSRGTVWIDAEDRVVSHWKASTLDGKLFFEQRLQRLEPRVWSTSRLHVNLNAAPALFPRDRREWLYEQTNPKRFSVSVDQKIAAPDTKQ